jgi:hypothetical protein
VQEHRAAGLCSCLKPSLRVLRGLRKLHLPSYLGCFPFLRNLRSQKACAHAALILQAAFEPSVASTARKGEFVRWLDHFDLLQTVIN